jgi:ATP/maltotriose-dependent transcriptional regulator MalT
MCGDCDKRSTCTKLCPEAERYASQDEVALMEEPKGFFDEQVTTIEYISNIDLTERERDVLTLLGRGLSRRDVCQLLDISRGSLRWHIHNLRLKS